MINFKLYQFICSGFEMYPFFPRFICSQQDLNWSIPKSSHVCTFVFSKLYLLSVVANYERDASIAAVEEEQKLASTEKYVTLLAMEDSHILGVISMSTSEPAIKSIEGASTEDGESGKWSPVLEIDDEINSASLDKEVAVVEVPKEAINEDAFSSTAQLL